MEGGREGGEAQEGGDVCIVMTDSEVVVVQKPTQHYKAIFLQLKNKGKKNSVFWEMVSPIFNTAMNQAK